MSTSHSDPSPKDLTDDQIESLIVDLETKSSRITFFYVVGIAWIVLAGVGSWILHDSVQGNKETAAQVAQLDDALKRKSVELETLKESFNTNVLSQKDDLRRIRESEGKIVTLEKQAGVTTKALNDVADDVRGRVQTLSTNLAKNAARVRVLEAVDVTPLLNEARSKLKETTEKSRQIEGQLTKMSDVVNRDFEFIHELRGTIGVVLNHDTPHEATINANVRINGKVTVLGVGTRSKDKPEENIGLKLIGGDLVLDSGYLRSEPPKRKED
jgi:methyl-accepting chemotaxis protein